MKLIVTKLLLPSTLAFVGIPVVTHPLSTKFSTTKISDSDVDRARDCAEHFGKCSVKEMQQLKKDLHKERLQSLIFEGPESARHSENRWIEEELELQIGLLKEKHDQQEEPLFLPDEEIFIYKEESLDIMALATDPPLDLNHPEPSHKHTGLHVPNAVEMHQIEETVLEENIMETVAMCLAVAGMMMLPQLLAAH